MKLRFTFWIKCSLNLQPLLYIPYYLNTYLWNPIFTFYVFIYTHTQSFSEASLSVYRLSGTVSGPECPQMCPRKPICHGLAHTSVLPGHGPGIGVRLLSASRSNRHPSRW